MATRTTRGLRSRTVVVPSEPSELPSYELEMPRRELNITSHEPEMPSPELETPSHRLEIAETPVSNAPPRSGENKVTTPGDNRASTDVEDSSESEDEGSFRTPVNKGPSGECHFSYGSYLILL